MVLGMDTHPDETVPVSYRITRRQRDALADLATREQRSVTAQIRYLIDQATAGLTPEPEQQRAA